MRAKIWTHQRVAFLSLWLWRWSSQRAVSRVAFLSLWLWRWPSQMASSSSTVWFGRRVKALWWVSKRRGVEDEMRSWRLNWWGRKWERGVNCGADEICKIRVSRQGYRLRFYFNRGLKLPNIASIEKQPRRNVFSQAPILKFSFLGCLIGFGS